MEIFKHHLDLDCYSKRKFYIPVNNKSFANKGIKIKEYNLGSIEYTASTYTSR